MKKHNQPVNLAISKLHQHPENPRKDLGDIAELAESIKKNGVMQNLTVIPGYWNEQNQFVESEDEYTIIIGHRRCAAAKAAGLYEVPCRIYKDMTREEQIGTMLEENMQRNDLTVYEQATSFQLMLDLGGTEDAICSKTGFSKKTVKHRLEIAKLNKNVLKEKEQDESFQLTLTDLYELEKIKDVKVRDRILKEARDSRDLRWRAKTAADNEKADLNYKAIAALLESKGIIKAPKSAENEQWSGKWEKHKEFNLLKDFDESEIAWKNTKQQLVYVRWYNSMWLVYPTEKGGKKALTAEELRWKQREKNIKTINGIMKQFKKEREKFVFSVYVGETEPVKNEVGALETLWDLACDSGTLFNSYTLKQDYIAAYACYGKPYSLDEAADNILYVPIWKQILLRVNDCISDSVVDYNCKYSVHNATRLKKYIEFLKEFGFSYDDEVNKCVEGTHELYEKGE